MADSDLDAELALFEKEIEEVANAVDVDADPNLSGNHPAGLDSKPIIETDVVPSKPAPSPKPTDTGNPAKGPRIREGAEPAPSAGPSDHHSTAPAVVLASGDAVVVEQPAWQRALQERDAQRIRAKQPEPSRVGTIANSSTGGASRGGLDMESRPSASWPVGGLGGPGQTGSVVAPQLGAWVWDGWQWVWDERAPAAVQPQWQAAEGSTVMQQAGQKAAGGSMGTAGGSEKKQGKRKRKRAAAGCSWEDSTLDEWPEDDFRVFVGDLAPDATEEELREAFGKYASFNMARVIVDKRTGEGKGYGFVSFAKGEDMVACLKEMNGKYVGSRPVSLKKSNWQKRDLTQDRKRDMSLFQQTGLVKRRRGH